MSNPAAVLRLCCCWGCDKKRKSVTETDRQNKNYFRNAIFHETLYFCLALSGTGCPINTLDLLTLIGISWEDQKPSRQKT